MSDITTEMRQAVYRADCESYGHMFDFFDVVSGSERPNPNDPAGMPMATLRSKDGQRLPHVRCQRCSAVWLVIDEAGSDYDDAVAKVAARIDRNPSVDAALTPWPVPGTEDVPIPLADGVVFDELPETHPAKTRLEQKRQEHEHAESVAASHDAVDGPIA